MTAAAPSPKPQAPFLIAGLIALVAGFAAVAVAVWHADAMPELAARAVSLLFFLFTAPFLVLAHEFGHYSAARMLGWRVPLFVWGAITVRLSPLRFSAGAPAFGSSASGAIVAVPPQEGASRWAWALVSAGGPLANILAAVLAGLAAWLVAAGSTAEALYLVFAAISLVSAIYNLLPVLPGSDGQHILAELTGGDLVAYWLSAQLTEQEIRGVRPRDWPPSLMAKVQRAAAWSNDPYWLLYLYAWHLDHGDVAQARDALDRCRGEPRVFAERAFVTAYFDRDGVKARRYLAQGQSTVLHHLLGYWRAEAAAAVAAGDAVVAREALRKGWQLWTSSPYATAFDTDWFDAIERRLTEGA